ncbi:MAG: type II secretion system protein [Candidatus Muiribacteriota bacterium]
MNIKKRAFTMVELMIVIGIIGMMVVMLSWQILASRGQKKAEIRTVDLYNARRAMQSVVEEIRNTTGVQAVGEKNIEYRSGDDSEIYNILFDNGELKKVYADNFEEKVIATLDNFSVKLEGDNQNVIHVELSAGEVNLKTGIYIRKN